MLSPLTPSPSGRGGTIGEFLGPDLVVEVLSPGDRPGETLGKIADWLSAGTRLVRVIDPERRLARIYRQDGSESILGEADTIPPSRPSSPLSRRAWPKRSVGCAWKPVSTSLIKRRQLSSSGRSHAHAHACGGPAVHPTQRRLSCGRGRPDPPPPCDRGG